MSAYKYKVIVKGKVYGEATTLAEAEAAAKKCGGKVLQAVGKAPRKPAAKKPKVSNPRLAKKRLANPSVRSGSYFGQTEGGDLFAATTLENLRKKADKLRRQGEVVESTAFKQIGSGADGYAQAIPNALAKPVANPKNPSLEAKNAAALLDAVKPGKPQVIHGVKVSRVGAGYSIDRVVLSRELAIKRLEQGSRNRNPELEPRAAATVLDTMRAGDTQTIHGVKVELQPVIDGTPVPRWQALAAIETGKASKTANPKAERLANPSVRNGNYFGQTESGDIFAAATLDGLRKKADKLRRQGEVVESTAYKQIGSGQDGYAQPIPNALGKYDNPKAKPAGPVAYI